MKFRSVFLAAAAILALAGASRADSVTVNLGTSAQNYVATGIGPNGVGDGQWFMQQGSCGFNGTVTTCNLTGSYTGTTPGFTSGTYDLVTTYAGGGPSPLEGQSTLPGGDIFFFSSIPPGTLITLDLNETGGGSFAIPMFNGATFVNGYDVVFGDAPMCSGTPISPCSFGGAGQTPGAVFADTVTGSSTFDSGTAVPTPEPASLLLLGTGFLGLAGFRRKPAAN